jgi:hypothetical protein
MQQAQQREIPERISWARAMIFGVGFFFIAAILVGQLPGYINLMMTASSLLGLEQGLLALAAVCLGGFIVIQTIVMLFDPKPVVPPIIFSGLGAILTVGGLALLLWAVFTNNQFFPSSNTSWASVLGGTVLWFQPGAVDFVMLGAVIFGVGVALIFYSVLALGELRNPDRSDKGTTPIIRILIAVGAILLIAFTIFYTYVSDQGLAYQLFPGNPVTGQLIVDTVINCILGIALFCVLGAFALRLHYLMRPVRKRTMGPLYMVGSLGLAQIGAICLLAFLFVYPLIDWMHTWTFLGLGSYFTICSKANAIPASCFFAPQAGYIMDTVISGASFTILMAAIVVWRTNRNLVIIGGVTIAAVLSLATLLVHTSGDEILIAMLLCGGSLLIATIWTSVARREFAIVGEKNLGCIGMWLVVGTCLFIYIAGFAFFSIPGFHETEPNIPFIAGSALPAHPIGNNPPVSGAADAVATFIIMILLAGLQFYFLVRNRYKV